MWLKIKHSTQLHKGDIIRQVIFEENKKHFIGYKVENKEKDVLSLLRILIDNIKLSESKKNHIDLFAPKIAENELEVLVN